MQLNSQIPDADNLIVMNRRLPVLLLSISLLLAACGAEEPPPVTTTPSPDAMVLTYALAAGQSHTFEVSMDQTLDMTTTGDASAMGEEDMPEDMSVRIQGEGTFTYAVSDGPEAGTYTVRLTGEFTDLTVTGTVDGEPVDPADIPDVADVGPLDFSITVDEKGNVITEDELDLDGLLGGLGALEDFGQMGGVDLGFFGPPMGDDPVTVGDTWSNDIELPGLGEDNYTIEMTSTVTGTETVDGEETLVIDTITNTPLIEFDLAEMIIGLFEAFLNFGDPSDEDLAEFQDIIDQIKFSFKMPASQAETRTWFDPEAGLSRKAEIAGSGGITVDVAMPDDTTGEIVAFGMTLSTTQKLSYRLITTSEG